MAAHDLEPDPLLTAEQLVRVAMLSEEESLLIDATLLASACDRYRKVAAIVGWAMLTLKGRISGIPDIYYAERVRSLVERGALIADGNLSYMRYSEVRLPKSDEDNSTLSCVDAS